MMARKAKKAAKKSAKRGRKVKAQFRPATTLAERIEEAMTLAIKTAMAEGVTDPGEIQVRINAAREKVANDV